MRVWRAVVFASQAHFGNHKSLETEGFEERNAVPSSLKMGMGWTGAYC